MTTSFFAPPECIRGDRLRLPSEESRHAVRVLRRRPGDEVVVVDGEGGWYRVQLDQADREAVSGVIVETRQDVGEPDFTLSIGLALLKQRSRFELFLEKAAELGTREVIPLLTERTEKGTVNRQRSLGIGVAAMKQCGRSRLVQVSDARSLEQVLRDATWELRCMAHEAGERRAALADVVAQVPAARRIRILIGPEGGFSDEEVETAREAGWQVVSLGPRRLRAETAALVAAAAVSLGRER